MVRRWLVPRIGVARTTTLLCVADSWSLSANCGAHAPYAYWSCQPFTLQGEQEKYIGSAGKRNGSRGDDGDYARLLADDGGFDEHCRLGDGYYGVWETIGRGDMARVDGGRWKLEWLTMMIRRMATAMRCTAMRTRRRQKQSRARGQQDGSTAAQQCIQYLINGLGDSQPSSE